MSAAEPLVSVVTPVYNGEAFLRQSIESVLGQTYSNWEHVIVNNCSKDHTREIVETYSKKDARIRLFDTDKLLPVIDNHNFAVRKMSSESRFCKLLHADDWMLPECIEKMVAVALEDPRVGVVGAYSVSGRQVRCDGLPYSQTTVAGHELARLTLMGKTYPFWSPSSTMIRSDLVLGRDRFYGPCGLHADVDAMYEILKQCDFGFVHQVLTVIREHEGSETSRAAAPLNTVIWSNLELLIRHGPEFLTPSEMAQRLRTHLENYYCFLADSFYEGRGRDFWSYHHKQLKAIGSPLNYFRLTGAIIGAILCRPRPIIRRLLARLGLRDR